MVQYCFSADTCIRGDDSRRFHVGLNLLYGSGLCNKVQLDGLRFDWGVQLQNARVCNKLVFTWARALVKWLVN